MDFKKPLAHTSVSITFSPNSDNELGLVAFSTLVRIDITIYCEVAAPVKRIPIIASLIFSITLSLTVLVLLSLGLLKWSSVGSGPFVIFFTSYLQCFT